MNKKIKVTYIVSGIFFGTLLLFAISNMFFFESDFYNIMFGLSVIPGIITLFAYIPYVIYMIIFSVKVYKETKNWIYILINLILVLATPPLWMYWVSCHQV